MFKHIIRSFAVVVLGLSIAAHAALAKSEPFEIEGAIARTTIGGVETPRRPAYTVGAQTFVVDGPMLPAVEAAVGQRLHLKGMLIQKVAIGCETAPTFEVGELALARVDTQESPIRIEGNIVRERSSAKIGGKTFVPAGPLAASLLALEGVCVEVTGAANPSVAAVESVFVTSIGRRDLTKDAVILPVDMILENVTADAVGRYTVEVPGTPAGVCDGTSARVKTAQFDKKSGTYSVTVETFGGIAGIWLGHARTYVYDVRGKLLESRVA